MTNSESAGNDMVELPRPLVAEVMASLATAEEMAAMQGTQRELRVQLGEQIGRLHDLHQELREQLSDLDRTLSAITARSIPYNEKATALRGELPGLRSRLAENAEQ